MNIPIRLWMLFLLSFSLFLRNEVDRQIEKNRFNHLDIMTPSPYASTKFRAAIS